MKRDYGMDSTDAQYAKMQMFTRPVRCASTAELGAALDKWGALGTQIGKPTDEDFKLIALKELVPKNIHDFMGTQVLLRKYPEAIAYVRRQVTEQRRASQVAQAQRQGRHGPTPMDLGAVTNNPLAQLLAAIERVTNALEAREATGTQGEETEWDSIENPLDKVIAALKGQGKGKKGAQHSTEARTCFKCGKKGHIQANCWSTATTDDKSGGKGKGQGKGKQGGGSGLATLGEEAPGANQADGGVTLSCLTREIACVDHPIFNAVSNKPSPGQWGGEET